MLLLLILFTTHRYLGTSAMVFYPTHEMLARWHAGQDVLVVDAPLPRLVALPRALSAYNSFAVQVRVRG